MYLPAELMITEQIAKESPLNKIILQNAKVMEQMISPAHFLFQIWMLDVDNLDSAFHKLVCSVMDIEAIDHPMLLTND